MTLKLISRNLIPASLALLALAVAETAAAQAADAPAAPAASEKKEAVVEEITVTGTRIRRKDLNTPAPVTVLSRDDIQSAGKVSLGEFLQTLPEQGNAVNAQVNNGNDGSVQVNLRSLGANRTLVLVNGRRFVSGGTGADATVDLNTIPAAAVERIEVLKDGASAIYGSDAIAGVVNIILKKRFEGTEATAYHGQSSRKDGMTTDVSMATGTASDRGSFLFTAGYQETGSVFAGDRKWAETTFDYDFTTGEKIPSGNSGTWPVPRIRVPTGACTAPADPELAALCAQGGSSFIYDPAGPAGAASFVPYGGELYNTNPTNYLMTPNRRVQFFSTGDFDLGGLARGFFEASYVNRTSSQSLAPMPVTHNVIPTKIVVISRDSMYNPFGIDIGTPGDGSNWRIRTTAFGDRKWTQDINTFRIVAGLDGTLGDFAGPLKGWVWGLSYNYGRTTSSQMNSGQIRMPNLANAVGPSMLVNGVPTCVRVAGNAATAIPGCVPLNVLGNDLNAAAKSYLSYDGADRGGDGQQVYNANVTGDLFSITASRPVALSLGFDYRKENAFFEPNPINGGLESAGNNLLATHGDYDVKEAYGELSVPLLSNLPGVEDFQVDLAARYTNYSTFGTKNTFKAGARWTPIRDVTLRGTLSSAYRAPNVAELYGGASDSYPGAIDPCRTLGPTSSPTLVAQCTADGVPAAGSGDTATQFLSKIQGDPNIKPETADIFTAGVVITPSMVRNLSVTVDYYNIKVKKLIANRGTAFILTQCYSAGNQAMCDLVHRDSVGLINFVDDPRTNTGERATSGVDFAGRYMLPVPGAGRFTLTVDGAYLINYDDTDITGFKAKQAGNYDFFGVLSKWKVNTGLSWRLAGLGAGVIARYTGSYKECASSSCSQDALDRQADPTGDFPSRTVKAFMPLDLYLSYDLKTTLGNTQFMVGMQNVFDADPPYVYNAFSANSDPSAYQYLGRYFYGRLTHRL